MPTIEADTESLVKASVICEWLSVNNSTLQQWRKRGMPCHQIGKADPELTNRHIRYRYVKAEIAEWLRGATIRCKSGGRKSKSQTVGGESA